MIITPIRQDLLPQVRQLMEAGRPYVQPRTPSDYWLYAQLFSSTCPVALDGDVVVGSIIAFRSQNDPDDIYVQDVMTHPDFRRHGIANALMAVIIDRARTWRCSRLYLTSEPDNSTAHHTWLKLGFTNLAGDYSVEGVSVTRSFKGPGKDRAVYQLAIPFRQSAPD